ncbi:hypothetical protein [Streptomyces sp. NPDC020571]|uniref:hypothetical protein n=1 Tax=Streptomyces sp. NPDC020571 TaxID=3365079 RepID=UPI0037A67275
MKQGLGARVGPVLELQRVMGRQWEDHADIWVVLRFRVSYQRVPGSAMTQQATTGLTEKLDATSIVCAWQVIST